MPTAQYICDICHETYSNELAAIHCEALGEPIPKYQGGQRFSFGKSPKNTIWYITDVRIVLYHDQHVVRYQVTHEDESSKIKPRWHYEHKLEEKYTPVT